MGSRGQRPRNNVEFRLDPERVGPIRCADFVRPLRGRHFPGNVRFPGALPPATRVNPLRGFCDTTRSRTRLVRNPG